MRFATAEVARQYRPILLIGTVLPGILSRRARVASTADSFPSAMNASLISIWILVSAFAFLTCDFKAAAKEDTEEAEQSVQFAIHDTWKDPNLRFTPDQLAKLLDSIPKGLRRRWNEARKRIEIRSVMKYKDGRSAAVINGKLMQPGGQLTFENGESYRLISINDRESFWMTQYREGETTTKHLLHKCE